MPPIAAATSKPPNTTEMAIRMTSARVDEARCGAPTLRARGRSGAEAISSPAMATSMRGSPWGPPSPCGFGATQERRVTKVNVQSVRAFCCRLRRDFPDSFARIQPEPVLHRRARPLRAAASSSDAPARPSGTTCRRCALGRRRTRTSAIPRRGRPRPLRTSTARTRQRGCRQVDAEELAPRGFAGRLETNWCGPPLPLSGIGMTRQCGGERDAALLQLLRARRFPVSRGAGAAVRVRRLPHDRPRSPRQA